MILFSHKDQTETIFGVSCGNFNKTVIGKDFAIAYVTKNPTKFLSWMIEEELKFEKKQEEQQLRMLSIISFWELNDGYTRGGFNNNHYQKVVSRKSELIDYTCTQSYSRIPKVQLKTIFPK